MVTFNVVTLLRQATDDLARHRGDRFKQFECVRSTMRQITQVDAFYVAEFVGGDFVHYHHQYDGEIFDLPGSMPIVAGRIAHWVWTHRRSYAFAHDNGRLLNAGPSFGQLDKVSKDALVVPVFNDKKNGEVTGLISIHAYVENIYNVDVIKALEYLAESLGAQLAHEERAAQRNSRLDTGYSASNPEGDAEDVLGWVVLSLNRLHAKFDLAIDNVGAQSADSKKVLRALRREVERLQSELWSRELHHQRVIAEQLRSLPPRPRELARLLADLPGSGSAGPTTAELALHMGISEVTVKSHMNTVLRVFDASDRSEVRSAVLRLTTPRSYGGEATEHTQQDPSTLV